MQNKKKGKPIKKDKLHKNKHKSLNKFSKNGKSLFIKLLLKDDHKKHSKKRLLLIRNKK